MNVGIGAGSRIIQGPWTGSFDGIAVSWEGLGKATVNAVMVVVESVTVCDFS